MNSILASGSLPLSESEIADAKARGFNEGEMRAAKAIVRKFPGVLTWVYALLLARAAVEAWKSQPGRER